MGFLSALKRSTDSTQDEMLWNSNLFNSESAAGINVNQQTALNATAVMSCVTMLAEDFAKLTPRIYRIDSSTGAQIPAADHPLYTLLYQPNEWQNWFEFAEMMQCSLLLRGNGYAVIVRSRRGDPIKLIPVNADWVALWESPDGGLFYRVTPNGLHMMAQLREAGEPFLIPAEDILHVRGFSANGLLGASRIMLAKEAIGLALAQEQQASRWIGNRATLSGVLTTDKSLTPDAAKRMAQDWKDMKGGVQNAGKIAVLEQGLKYQSIAMNATDLEFVASRTFQLQEVARIWRVPLHMLGDLTRSTNNNISQQSQEYINLTLSSYTSRWRWKLHTTFGLRDLGIFVTFDLTELTRADITARYANYARAISAGFLSQNEARIDDGRDPKTGQETGPDALLAPSNLSATGSNVSGDGADGGGRPNSDGTPAASQSARQNGALFNFDIAPRSGRTHRGSPDQPRDDHGRWTGGFALTETGNEESAGTKPSVLGVYLTEAGLNEAFDKVGALREANDQETDLETHQVFLPDGVKAGDKVYLTHSPDAAQDESGAALENSAGTNIHGVYADKAQAKAEQIEISEANWAAHGPDYEFGESTSDADWNKTVTAWNEAHPDQEPFSGDGESPKGFEEFGKSMLGISDGQKEPFPGIAAANEHFENSGDIQHAVYLSSAKVKS